MRVVGLLYSVTQSGVCVTTVEDGVSSATRLAFAHELVSHMDGLTANLQDLTAVAQADLPALETFASDWGRRLIPRQVLDSPPDVLVVIPHGFLHTLPLHLVRTSAGPPLASSSGVAYSSSFTSFCRCAVRNEARRGRRSAPMKAAGGGVDAKTGDHRYAELAAEVLADFGTEPGPCTRLSAKVALESGDVEVVCLVGHGYVDPREHRSSGLLLEEDFLRRERGLPLYGGQLVFDDVPLRDCPTTESLQHPTEVLTLSELETITSHAQLTLLLACAAGSARVLQADEPASLADAMVRVGSVSVIAPMWESRLDVTARWVSAFAAAWRGRQLSKALAAREAFRSLDEGGAVALLGPLHLRGDWV